MSKHTAFWQDEAGLVDIADVNLKVQDCLDLILPEIEPALQAGSNILDFGCGVGRLTIPVAWHFKDAKLIGYDIAQQFIDRAITASYKARIEDHCYFTTDLDKGLTADAAYSMLVLQHIPNAEKPAIFERIARTLNDAGIFRFQYVEGDSDTFLTHDATWPAMLGWLHNAGFEVQDVDFNLIWPRWTWVTAVKKGKR